MVRLLTVAQTLCEYAGHWQELESAEILVHVNPPKHGHWVTCLICVQAHARTGMSSASRKCTLSRCDMRQEWQDDGSEDLITIFLHIPIAPLAPAHPITPPSPSGVTPLITSNKPLTNCGLIRCHQPDWDSSMKRTLLQSATRHQRRALATQVSNANVLQSNQDPPKANEHSA